MRLFRSCLITVVTNDHVSVDADHLRARAKALNIDPFSEVGVAAITAADGEAKWLEVWQDVHTVKARPWSAQSKGRDRLAIGQCLSASR